MRTSGAARLRLACKFPAPSTGPGKLRAKWRAARTAKPCGPGRRCYGQALAEAAVASTGAAPVDFARVREARTNSAPGRARHKPSDHRAGKAVCWASPVCCCAVFCVCSMRSRPRVRAGTRPSLRPSWLERVERRSKARVESAARTRRRACNFKCAARLRCPSRLSRQGALFSGPKWAHCVRRKI